MWELKESIEHLDLQCEMLEEYNHEYLFWYIIEKNLITIYKIVFAIQNVI